MVSARNTKYRYFTANDGELDSLLRGEDIGATAAADFPGPARLKVGQTGVLVAAEINSDEPLRPLALVARDQDIRRLCGRYAHLRNEFSPLTAWCHLLTPSTLQRLDGIEHEPDLRGTEAAWSGLVIAEAMLLSGKPLSKIRLSACLASATYAIARAKALWKELPIETILERFELANRLCRGDSGFQRKQSATTRVRASLLPIWACLSALSDDTMPDMDQDDVHPLVAAMAALREARAARDSGEAVLLARPLLKDVPEAQEFERLTKLTPESRLQLFDQLVGTFKQEGQEQCLRRNSLALLAGYLATVVAGGSASLPLVEEEAGRSPELTAWAYVVGGIGERIPWTSGFDGLGRMVARELQRRLRLDEPPTCDFALDEARVLWDKGLKDPLVHLRIKQARILSVATFPGVNIAIPIVRRTFQPSVQRELIRSGPVSTKAPTIFELTRALKTLAEALPFLQQLSADESVRGVIPESQVGIGAQRRQTRKLERAFQQLPLTKSEGQK